MIDVLKKLADAWKQGDPRHFVLHYRQLRLRFAKSHEALIRRIVDLVWKRAVREADYRTLADLSKIGPAPEVDPRWRRAQALLAENPESDASADEVESAWVAYADDLSRLECLRDEERLIAVGLVQQRLARDLAQYAHEFDSPSPFGSIYHEDLEAKEDLLDAAAKHYCQSIEACPRLEESYLELAKLYEENEEVDKAAKIMEKLTRQDPDCFEAMIWLAHLYLSQDEPAKSERHVEAVRRLRPRDPRCVLLAWNQKVTMIRCLAIKRQFEAARQEIREADETAPPDLELYTLDLLRAGSSSRRRTWTRLTHTSMWRWPRSSSQLPFGCR